ncbi:MAG: flavodoxin-dependent (E)-4-hydroxy-3-methylbut-2-enyl-diphosphate synthase [Oscillospiraceae bacterium]|jgi:(E)-4-hydroxy-3-methylbut-2-enyl-diphosphate synthase|nr:flavodoxin-dependent (E)-4-hydroxy-3-methylbut-2-enyl-diphosphate synthase [Oscillospiraceae bacterium]
MNRKKTKVIRVGDRHIGGAFPISVQSMCSTKTDDIDATLAQIEALEQAGCEIVRLAVPNARAAKALPDIRKNCRLPLVADIHFDYRLALAAVEAGFDKIRINPGNIGSPAKAKLVADACRANGVPIRIGVNAGSLEKDLLERLGPTPEALCESALRHVRILEDFNFDEICISVKSSRVADTVAACRRVSTATGYPLHLGVTETGTPGLGIVKSAAGIGALLMDGIGDTLRVSLTADPVEEVRAGLAILKAVGLRQEGVSIIACPTCGRTDIDLISTVHKVEELLGNIKAPLTVAVMGCAVNGPGEAREADYGLAGGRGEGVLFRRGALVKKVPEAELAQALYALIIQDAEASQ